HERARETLRFFSAAEIDRAPVESGDIRKRTLLRTPVSVVMDRYVEMPNATREIVAVQAHELLRLIERQPAQQDRVDHAEYRRGQANTDRERERGNQREAWIPARSANGWAEIVVQGEHRR